MNTKPFHLSVIDTIVNCTGPGEDARKTLTVIGNLIISTKIPENHVSIAREFTKAVDYWSDGQQMFGLLSNVLDKLKKE